MTIGDFCKACGSRLGDLDNGYCAAKACQDYARTVAMAKGHLAMNTGDPRKVVCKDELIARIDSEIVQKPTMERLNKLMQIRLAVIKYPWDDVTSFAQLVELKAKSVPLCPSPTDIPSTLEKIGVVPIGPPATYGLSPFCSGCHLTLECCKCLRGHSEDIMAFKSDLTRLALAKPVKTLRMSVFDIGRQHSGGSHGGWVTTIRGHMSEEDYKLLGGGEIEIVIPNPGEQYFAVPVNKQKVTTKEEVDEAIAGNCVRKRHVDVAEGAQLAMIAMMFLRESIRPGRRVIRRLDTNGPGSLETDEQYRKRIKEAMPIERGDKYFNRHDGHRVVEGIFDAAHGAHLDTVAEINGLKRKPGETDLSLQGRLYKAVEG